MDRRQAVAELVGQPGSELAETGQRVLQPQLLFERDDTREIGEETDDAGLPGLATHPRRQRHAEVRWPAHEPGRHVAARHRGAAVFDGIAHQGGQRRHVLQQVGDVGRHRPRCDAEDAVSGRIQHPDPAVAARHEQTRGQALDDLRVEPLGGLGAGQRGALLRLQLGHGLLQSRRQQGRLDVRLAQVPAGIARRPHDPQQREAEQAGQEADDGGEAEQQIAGRREFGHGRLGVSRTRRTSRSAAVPASIDASAPSARNVPKGSAYFIVPRRSAIRPTPTIAPAKEASTSVSSICCQPRKAPIIASIFTSPMPSPSSCRTR